MQLLVRGSSSSCYAVEANSFEELIAQIASVEGSQEVLLYASGKPITEEIPLGSLQNVTLDVTLPLKGGKVIRRRSK